MTRLTLSLIASLLLFYSAEIYRWVNESRRIHLGNRSKDKDNAELLLSKVDSYKSVSYDIVRVVKTSQHISAENGAARPADSPVFSAKWYQPRRIRHLERAMGVQSLLLNSW
ncbi:hypothetical protein [Pseudomonas sp. RW409]|uniref:hypothetical protein n=1 Tax=Pseudomonas sp. RW409 TaxID=2202895 RepID=UPI002113B499|nr:hypothetical protein [Pseudomonas sp. RW409]